MHENVLPFVAWLISGIAFIVFGVFVANVRPRVRSNVAFAVFAVAFGLNFVGLNVVRLLHVEGSFGSEILQTVLATTWVAGLVAVAFLFPTPVTRRDRPALLAAAGLWLALIGIGLPAVFLLPADVSLLFRIRATVSSTALVGLLLLLTLRYRNAPDSAHRRQFALTAAAFAVFVGLIAGSGITGGPDNILHATGWWVPVAWVRFLSVLVIAGLWLHATWGPDAHIARNMTILCLLMLLIGLLAVVFARPVPVLPTGQFVMVLLLTYAILRHQLLGVDVRVRWGISKSVLAASFVAVFFVVTELTKWFFESRFAGTPGLNPALLGIIAAGLLVFVISPLHRFADALANRAVPVGEPAPGVPPQRREVSYRRMVKRMLADGRISREEERALAELAGDLGIEAGRAFALREEVEKELISPDQGRQGTD